MPTTGITDLEITNRPKFLKVLCILTFIGTGATLIIDVLQYLYMNHFAEALLNANNLRVHQMPILNMQQIPESVHALSEFIIRLNVSILILEISGLLLCFLGSLLMWKMRKKGFFIYLGGQLVIIIIIMVFFIILKNYVDNDTFSNAVDNLNLNIEGFWAVAMFLWLVSPIISIVFVLLYSMILKHLR